MRGTGHGYVVTLHPSSMGTFSRILGTNVPRGGTFLGRNVPKKCSFLPRTFFPLRNICSSRDLHVIDKDQITALSVHVTSTTPDPGDNWPWRRLCVVCQYLYAHGTALRKNVPILAKSNVPKNVPMELGCKTVLLSGLWCIGERTVTKYESV